jgi:hypothetical protein
VRRWLLGAEAIKFKLVQGLQHVEGVTEHRLPFSTVARPSVIARCSVAAADDMVDAGTSCSKIPTILHLQWRGVRQKERLNW